MCYKSSSHSKTTIGQQLKLNNEEIASREFFISNSLGAYDFRLANKCSFLDKFTIVDFGIDSEDVFELVFKSLC